MEIPAAGRELDRLVAERIMGWTGVHFQNPGEGFETGLLYGTPPVGCPQVVPSYSCDKWGAWTLVERIRESHKAWCEKLAECLVEAVRRFEGMSDELKTSYCNDPDVLANELAGPKPFDFDVFFSRIQRTVERRWPYAFLYITPEMICRSAIAALSEPKAA